MTIGRSFLGLELRFTHKAAESVVPILRQLRVPDHAGRHSADKFDDGLYFVSVFIPAAAAAESVHLIVKLSGHRALLSGLGF
jgi:hypothetical protein